MKKRKIESSQQNYNGLILLQRSLLRFFQSQYRMVRFSLSLPCASSMFRNLQKGEQKYNTFEYVYLFPTIFVSVFDEVMDYFKTFLHGNDTEKYAGFVVICSKVKNVSKHSVHSPFFFNFFLPRTKTYAKLQRQNKKLKASFRIIYKLDVRVIILLESMNK